MALLEVRNLKKYFRAATGTLHAVDDVTFDIESGKTLGIVGESGCGKSTLGKTILHMEEPTEGSIAFDGEDITKVHAKKLKKLRTEMQMIFQDPYSSLDPRMSVTQLIEEPLIIHKVERDKDVRKRRVQELMDTVGIAQRFAHAYPHELDGGRRQRIGIARALALNPKFIVCDEPVSALDVSIQAQVINLLQDLQREKGLTYMFITHDLSVVRYISDEICVMYLGQIVERCKAEDLFGDRLRHPYSQALLSAVLEPQIHERQPRKLLQGELTSPIDPKPQCRFAPRCPFAGKRCLAEEPKLQDVGGGHLAACHLLDGDVNEVH